MNNFTDMLTPEEAFKQEIMEGCSLEEYQRRARNESPCQVCGQPVWRMVDTGMCFTCTTGEADASQDYELALIK